MSDAHILILDDDTRIRELLSQYLKEQHFFVSTAKDANQANELLSLFSFDLLIVDVMLPGESGMEFTSNLRKTLHVPVLMLTAMGESEDRIAGLESGADDYLPKPFEPKELLLRIQRIIQRTKGREQQFSERLIPFSKGYYNMHKQHLVVDNSIIPLGTRESILLSVLINHQGQTLSRSTLAALCSEAQKGAGNIKTIHERSIDVQITRLRQKIESNPKQPVCLKTIRGAGYMLVPYTEV